MEAPVDDPVRSRLPVHRIALALAALAAVGLVGGYGVAMRSRPRPAKVALSSQVPSRRAPARVMFVHVGGSVRTPGLYRLPEGSRVDDAVDAAGGAIDDADIDALNLAAKVRDGDKVLVPHRGASADGGAGAASGDGKLVNLNIATVADLDTLPGIGPALAQRIIDYREQHGGFHVVEDLSKVPGIGPRKLDELRDLVTV